MQKWIVHGWYKNQKNVENFGNFLEILSHFGHISKNIPKIDILVFYDSVGPQDATFDKYRFFETFTSFSKVRGKKRTISLLMTGQ